MANKYQLYRDLSQYETLKSDLNKVASYLSEATVSANNIGTILTDNYSINDSGNKAIPRSKKLATNIGKESDYITGTIIPAIDSKMEAIREEIRQEEERERKEAEEMASRLSSFWW